MSRLRNRHCRPTRTAGIFPALISRYTVRRLTCRYSRTSSVVRKVSSIMRACSVVMRRFRTDWQLNRENSPTLRVVGGRKVASVLLNDAVRDGQPETRAFPDVL